MANYFTRHSQARAPSAGHRNYQAIGRSILIVSPDERQRNRWAHAVGHFGYRPILAETPKEGRRLLSSLVVQAAIVERDPGCTAIERACSSLLLVALDPVPTLVVTDRSVSEDDLVRQSQQLLALASPRAMPDMIEISGFHLKQYVSEPALRN